MSNYILRVVLPNQKIRHIPINRLFAVPAEQGAKYALIYADSEKPVDGVVLTRKGDNLLVAVGRQDVVHVNRFYQDGKEASFPMEDSATASSAPTLADGRVTTRTESGSTVHWPDFGNFDWGDLGKIKLDGLGVDGKYAPIVLGGVALGGLLLLVSKDDEDGDSSASSSNSSVVNGTVMVGPVVGKHDLKVILYKADGSSKLGDEVPLDSSGKFSINVGVYTGVVIAKVTDNGTANDYLDEATNGEKDLAIDLYAAGVLSGSSLTLNVNPLTTLAQKKMGANPSETTVNESNSAIATLFGVSDLHKTTVIAVNGSSTFDSSNGLSAGETYGAYLAALSGMDKLGSMQGTLDTLLNNVTVSGSSATVNNTAQTAISNGAAEYDKIASATKLSKLPDTFGPVFSSAATATAIAENSGANQQVYTASATDKSAITYSIKESSSGLTIDSSTGVVTLTGNPNYESKASYSFTVVAKDASNNSSELKVTLPINNKDEIAPSMTSAATASLTEGQTAGQTAYTATAVDSGYDGGPSNPLSFSIKSGVTGEDAGSFSINSSTGVVTINTATNASSKSQYKFTVIAQDSAGNSSEKQVTLTITAAIPVQGVVQAGPVISGHDLTLALYKADGTTKLSDVTLASDGTFSTSISGYSGVVIAKISSSGTANDYLDEATNANKSLNADLYTAGVASAGSTLTLNINPLTSIAYQKMGASPSSTTVNTANDALASVFGVGNLHSTSVVSVNGSSTTFNSSDGLTAGEKYGALLAALSGADKNNAGNTATTISALASNISISGSTASLNATAQAAISSGAAEYDKIASADKKTQLSDIFPPSFTSATTATAVNENSGSGQTIYTAAATDSSTVSYSIKTATNSDYFSINSSTGVVTLSKNVGTQALSFTVVAKDVALNSAEQTVTLPVNSSDVTAPTVSSVSLSAKSESSYALLNQGDSVTATVTFSEPINVTGAPRLALNIGGTTVYASYDAVSGSNASFKYTLLAGQSDSDGISIASNALELNGGTIKDAAANSAVLNHAAVVDNASYKIDTSAPTVQLQTTMSSTQLEAIGKSNGNDYAPHIASLGSDYVVAWHGVDSAGDDSVFVQQFNRYGSSVPYATVQLEATGKNNGKDQSAKVSKIGSSGEYAVAWQGEDSAGDNSTLVQKFKADGSKNGSVIQLEAISKSTGSDNSPQLTAIGSNGEFVVTWYGEDSAGDNSIFVQKINADASLATPVQLEALSNSTGDDLVPQVSAVGTGFVVSWTGVDSAGDYSIFVQKFNADGSLSGTTTQIESSSNNADIEQQTVALGSDGAFVLAWSAQNSSNAFQILVQKFNADGTTTGNSLVTLAGSSSGDNRAPQLTTIGSSGEFVVTWHGQDSDGDASIFVQKFNANGTVNGDKTKLEAVSKADDNSPQMVALGSDGAFVVVWSGKDSAGDYSIFVQKFNANGSSNSMVQLEALGKTDGDDSLPSVSAIGSSGEFAVAWSGVDSAGDLSIFSQKFSSAGTVAGDVSIQSGSSLTLQSSETGTAYLVNSSVTVSTAADITSAASTLKASATINTANSDTTLTTTGLAPGDYKLYSLDAAGNLASNSNTINVTANPNVVVFDLVTGKSSSHSTRSFEADTSYTIYLKVDADSATLSSSTPAWKSANNLGSDDKVILVGDGASVLGKGNQAVNAYANKTGKSAQWKTAQEYAAQLTPNGAFTRHANNVEGKQALWTGKWSTPDNGLALNAVYLTKLPVGVLTSQGLV